MREDAPELTAELVGDGDVPSQPATSPDGRWVAYAVAPVGRRGERPLCALWVAAADGSSPPRRLTAGTAADADPRWAPDSASVFFLSDRAGSRQLHRIRLGGEGGAGPARRGGGRAPDGRARRDLRCPAAGGCRAGRRGGRGRADRGGRAPAGRARRCDRVGTAAAPGQAATA